MHATDSELLPLTKDRVVSNAKLFQRKLDQPLSIDIPEPQRKLFQAIKTGDFKWIMEHQGTIIWTKIDDNGTWRKTHPLFYCAKKGNIESFEILFHHEKQNFPPTSYSELIRDFILENNLPDHLFAEDLADLPTATSTAQKRIGALLKCQSKYLHMWVGGGVVFWSLRYAHSLTLLSFNSILACIIPSNSLKDFVIQRLSIMKNGPNYKD